MLTVVMICVVVLMKAHKEKVSYMQRCTRRLKHENWKIRRDTVYDLARELKDNFRYHPTDIVTLLLKTLQDKDWHVQDAAIATLSQELDTYVAVYDKPGKWIPVIDSWLKSRVVQACFRLIENEHPSIRKEAVIVLGKSNDVRAVSLLLAALGDESESIRQHAAAALETICKRIRVVVFNGEGTSEGANQKDTIWNPDVANLTTPMNKLKQIVIDAAMCDIRQVEIFTEYMAAYLGKTYLHDHVTLTVHGNPMRFNPDTYEVWTSCKTIDVFVENVVFGTRQFRAYSAHSTVHNPDVSAFTIPMSYIRHLVIDTETHNFYQVERFLTYAVNYIGEKNLKKHLEVHIYGDPEKLQPNLRNNLMHLCKRIHVHKESEGFHPHEGK